jgi:hypothetical protein
MIKGVTPFLVLGLGVLSLAPVAFGTTDLTLLGLTYSTSEDKDPDASSTGSDLALGLAFAGADQAFTLRLYGVNNISDGGDTDTASSRLGYGGALGWRWCFPEFSAKVIPYTQLEMGPDYSKRIDETETSRVTTTTTLLKAYGSAGMRFVVSPRMFFEIDAPLFSPSLYKTSSKLTEALGETSSTDDAETTTTGFQIDTQSRAALSAVTFGVGLRFGATAPTSNPASGTTGDSLKTGRRK